MTRNVLLVAVLLASASLPVQAGWLVLRDGTPVETRGAWRIADNRVTYSQPDGRRVSVMIVVVDPDATRLANMPGAPPPAARANPPAEAGRKKFVIDNEALKKNRVKKPAEEKQKLQLAAVAEVLKLIADCATRHPQDQQAYQICCQRSLPH